MKNILLLLISIFLLLTSFHFKNTTSSDVEANAVISADKMNVFYIGLPNAISVAISDVPIEKTKVSIDKGTITPTNTKGQYEVRVFETGKVTISVEGTDNKGSKVKSSSEFRTKRIPNPTPMLGNKRGGMISIGEMKAQRGILAPLLNFDIDARWKVLSFVVERVRMNETSVILENKGGAFSGEVRQLIQGSKTGDIYHFFNIEVKGFDGLNRRLNEMSFKIKG